MMPAPIPLSRDLVLVGGGHTHALVLRKWGMAPLPGARLTVIDPNPVAQYSGMLPGQIEGIYKPEQLQIDLVRLCRFAGARLIIGRAVNIDPAARRIVIEDRGSVGYDVASLDIGVTSAMPDLSGFTQHGVPVKPMGVFSAAWDRFLRAVVSGTIAPQAAVIGGGIAGIEIAIAMATAIRTHGASPSITLLEAGPAIAATNPRARRRLRRALHTAGVCVRTEVQIRNVTDTTIELADGSHVPSGFTVGAAGARAHGWLGASGLPVTEDGFIRVGADLRVEATDGLFAVGDCAHLCHAPRPKAGVFAVRAAPVLGHNLRAALSGGDLRSFSPQKHYLKLISLGQRTALAERGGFSLSAPGLWRWKDQIDKKFMQKFIDLPSMRMDPPPPVSALGSDALSDPLCGGCGSKVAPGTLAAVLANAPSPGRKDVLSGPGDDAAIIVTGGQKQVLSTDHLRAVTEDFGAMARIAALHALGDIWAMGALPQSALVSLTLPRMSEALQARTLQEIMEAAGAAIRMAGADIVGGHSTMGTELTIGLSLTGLLDGAPITNADAQPGDRLILTREIGSGTLLAAEMRGLAKGADIAALMNRLQTPQGDAAAVLLAAHAMTDVTGFGLAGHLAAICRASSVGAEIDLGLIPTFAGAEALADQGVRSTIWQANRDAAPVIGATGPKAALLHDPQTAGGLLAAVPADNSAAILKTLRKQGHDATDIGRVIAGPPTIHAV